MAYSDKAVDHFEHPRNVGAFDAGDACVGTGVAQLQGSGVVRLQIRVDAATNTIAGVCFKVHGGVAAIASASLLGEWVQGKTLDEATGLQSSHIVQELALEPMQMHGAILAHDAILAAINDYQAKHGVAAEKV